MTKNLILSNNENIKLKGVFIANITIIEKYRVYKYETQSPIRSGSTKTSLINNAKLNAYYIHNKTLGREIKSGSNNLSNIIINNYRVEYLGEKQKLIKIKRIKIRGKYYTQVRDTKTGKILTSSKWTYIRNLDKYN